jgi:hypothetical protein
VIPVAAIMLGFRVLVPHRRVPNLPQVLAGLV